MPKTVPQIAASRQLDSTLRRLEVKARLDGSLENLTDEGVFSAFRDLVAQGGGADAFAVALHADREMWSTWLRSLPI